MMDYRFEARHVASQALHGSVCEFIALQRTQGKIPHALMDKAFMKVHVTLAGQGAQRG